MGIASQETGERPVHSLPKNVKTCGVQKGEFDMLAEILGGQVLLYVMGVLFLLAAVSKCAVGISYKRLVKASDDMASDKNALTRQLKLKFENCYKLHLNVQNVPVFVDKYLQKYKRMGVRVHTLHRLSFIAITFEALMMAVGCGTCLLYQGGTQQLGRYLMTGVLSILGLLCVDSMWDIEDKRGMVVTNLQDYLDNVLSNRLQHEYRGEERLTEERKVLDSLEQEKERVAATQLNVRKFQKEKPEKEGGRRQKKRELEEEAVIREILREFLM